MFVSLSKSKFKKNSFLGLNFLKFKELQYKLQIYQEKFKKYPTLYCIIPKNLKYTIIIKNRRTKITD